MKKVDFYSTVSWLDIEFQEIITLKIVPAFEGYSPTWTGGRGREKRIGAKPISVPLREGEINCDAPLAKNSLGHKIGDIISTSVNGFVTKYKIINIMSAEEEQKRKTEAQKNELEDFLKERGIEYLIHFTSKENIESIKKYGLLPRDFLEEKGIEYKYNDDARYDGYNDAISLSITKPNIFLLKKFVSDKSLAPMIIKIDATLLYEEIEVKRIYCVTNAATYSTKSLNGETLEHFKNLFQEKLSYEVSYGETRRTLVREGLSNNLPTDIQAEILFFGRIDPKYFISIEEI